MGLAAVYAAVLARSLVAGLIAEVDMGIVSTGLAVGFALWIFATECPVGYHGKTISTGTVVARPGADGDPWAFLRHATGTATKK